MNDKRGFLYIANKTKFIHEALISVKIFNENIMMKKSFVLILYSRKFF